ncbi:hypothetical protein BD626DRAFT_542390 [Schizophyllum amplum]|uniref:Uncharacterized protein n=1 Tax=Schizophyllum amplum TaxID=97359 RepID=A0A550BSK3_9AGAR|nr:hypothetical protein BD626DRAFT_542390 [Auriculariopsis ampla]
MKDKRTRRNYNRKQANVVPDDIKEWWKRAKLEGNEDVLFFAILVKAMIMRGGGLSDKAIGDAFGIPSSRVTTHTRDIPKSYTVDKDMTLLPDILKDAYRTMLTTLGVPVPPRDASTDDSDDRAAPGGSQGPSPTPSSDYSAGPATSSRQVLSRDGAGRTRTFASAGTVHAASGVFARSRASAPSQASVSAPARHVRPAARLPGAQLHPDPDVSKAGCRSTGVERHTDAYDGALAPLVAGALPSFAPDVSHLACVVAGLGIRSLLVATITSTGVGMSAFEAHALQRAMRWLGTHDQSEWEWRNNPAISLLLKHMEDAESNAQRPLTARVLSNNCHSSEATARAIRGALGEAMGDLLHAAGVRSEGDLGALGTWTQAEFMDFLNDAAPSSPRIQRVFLRRAAIAEAEKYRVAVALPSASGTPTSIGTLRAQNLIPHCTLHGTGGVESRRENAETQHSSARSDVGRNVEALTASCDKVANVISARGEELKPGGMITNGRGQCGRMRFDGNGNGGGEEHEGDDGYSLVLRDEETACREPVSVIATVKGGPVDEGKPLMDLDQWCFGERRDVVVAEADALPENDRRGCKGEGDEDRMLWDAVDDDWPWGEEHEDAARMAEQAFASEQLKGKSGRSSTSVRPQPRSEEAQEETQEKGDVADAPEEKGGRTMKRLRRLSPRPPQAAERMQHPGAAAQPAPPTKTTSASRRRVSRLWLDTEAIHSGSGGSSESMTDEDGASSTTDDFIASADDDGVQGTEVGHLAGMLSQNVIGGPEFDAPPVRNGPFGGPRDLRVTRVSGPAHDSHAEVATSSGEDEYSVGSFVVSEGDEEDDEEEKDQDEDEDEDEDGEA